MPNQAKHKGAAPPPQNHAVMLERMLEKHEAELDARRQALRNEIALDASEVRDAAAWSADRFACGLSAALLEATGRTRHNIEAALARLKTSSFGVCADCDGKIPLARLAALPFAETCRDCQECRDAEEADRVKAASAVVAFI